MSLLIAFSTRLRIDRRSPEAFRQPPTIQKLCSPTLVHRLCLVIIRANLSVVHVLKFSTAFLRHRHRRRLLIQYRYKLTERRSIGFPPQFLFIYFYYCIQMLSMKEGMSMRFGKSHAA